MTLPDGWQIEHEGAGRFFVQRPGGGGPYLVDLLEADGPRCSCLHDEIRLLPFREEHVSERICVHSRRCILFLGEQVVAKLRELESAVVATR